MPKKYLELEEKKLLVQLRKIQPTKRRSTGTYWKSMIPSEDDLEFVMETLPDNCIEEEKTNATYSFKVIQTIELPSGVVMEIDRIETKVLPKSYWYYVSLEPYILEPLPEGNESNRYESNEWVPELFHKNTWRKCSEHECRHWADLIYCPFCGRPIWELERPHRCFLCKGIIGTHTAVQKVKKRVLQLVCILPDY